MAEEGKFFFIRSQMHDLVLTVKDNATTDGTEVRPFPSFGAPSQLWYEDKLNNVIRNKSDDHFVLDCGDDGLVINEYRPDEYWQHWKLAGDHVESTEDSSKCLNIMDECEDEGAPCGAQDFEGGPHQTWTFEYVTPADFYIRSKSNGTRCIDIRKADTSAGAKCVLWDCASVWDPNQTWYEDKYGYIHSRLNDMVLDTVEGSARMQELDTSVPGRTWVKNGDKITQRTNPARCLQLRTDKDQGKNGNKVEEADYTGGDHQQWVFDYKR